MIWRSNLINVGWHGRGLVIDGRGLGGEHGHRGWGPRRQKRLSWSWKRTSVSGRGLDFGISRALNVERVVAVERGCWGGRGKRLGLSDDGTRLGKVDTGWRGWRRRRSHLARTLVSQEAEAVEGVEGKKGQPEVERDASEGREPKNENTNVY